MLKNRGTSDKKKMKALISFVPIFWTLFSFPVYKSFKGIKWIIYRGIPSLRYPEIVEEKQKILLLENIEDKMSEKPTYQLESWK